VSHPTSRSRAIFEVVQVPISLAKAVGEHLRSEKRKRSFKKHWGLMTAALVRKGKGAKEGNGDEVGSSEIRLKRLNELLRQPKRNGGKHYMESCHLLSMSGRSFKFPKMPI
jgi:hypothetical protein